MKPQLLAALSKTLDSTPIDATYLVGVSGGRDSVALLDGLVSLGYGSLVVCHFDHGLRKESAEETRFVKELAAHYQLEFVSAREDVKARAERDHLSIETAAREARYEFFASVARKHNTPRLFLAHHADDQVETFLFNLFRGAGPKGLGGMSAFSNRIIDGIELLLLRPLLAVWREEIDAFISERQLHFREDPSNAVMEHTRNRLRHQLLPELEQIFGRQIRETLWRNAEIFRAEDHFMKSQVALPGEELSVVALLGMSDALQRRAVHAWLKARGVPEVGFQTVERVRALITSLHAKVNIPGDMHVRRRAKRLFIEKPT